MSDGRGIVELIMHLPCKLSDATRRSAAELLLRYMGDDTSIIGGGCVQSGLQEGLVARATEDSRPALATSLQAGSGSDVATVCAHVLAGQLPQILDNFGRNLSQTIASDVDRRIAGPTQQKPARARRSSPPPVDMVAPNKGNKRRGCDDEAEGSTKRRRRAIPAMDSLLRSVIQKCKGRGITGPLVNATIKTKHMTLDGKACDELVDDILTRLVGHGLAESVVVEGGNTVPTPHVRRWRWKKWSDIVQLPDFAALQRRLSLSPFDFPLVPSSV